MDPHITSVIREFREKKEFLASLLLNYSQRYPLRQRNGAYDDGTNSFTYVFHGIGCFIEHDSHEYNFDFLFENGIICRIDGFDIYALRDYSRSIGNEQFFDDFKAKLIQYVASGYLIRSSEQQNTYFLKEDYWNNSPKIFHMVWDKEWYLRNG